MTEEEIAEGGLAIVEGEWNLRYRYFAGEAATRFYDEVRHNKRIIGAKCSSCKRVLLPPRGYCEQCFEPINEWPELGLEGRVTTFTILTLKLEGFPPPPVLIAYVQLDGADTSVANYLDGVDLSDVEEAGRRLAADPPRARVVFHDLRTGGIGDFHFEVI